MALNARILHSFVFPEILRREAVALLNLPLLVYNLHIFMLIFMFKYTFHIAYGKGID